MRRVGEHQDVGFAGNRHGFLFGDPEKEREREQGDLELTIWLGQCGVNVERCISRTRYIVQFIHPVVDFPIPKSFGLWTEWLVGC